MYMEIFLINLVIMLISVSITFAKEKKTPWIIIITAILLLIGDMFYGIYQSEMKIDKAYIEQMETRNDFTGHEVDKLWRWRHCKDASFGPSERFKELYDSKIKPLPGARY